MERNSFPGISIIWDLSDSSHAGHAERIQSLISRINIFLHHSLIFLRSLLILKFKKFSLSLLFVFIEVFIRDFVSFSFQVIFAPFLRCFLGRRSLPLNFAQVFTSLSTLDYTCNDPRSFAAFVFDRIKHPSVVWVCGARCVFIFSCFSSHSEGHGKILVILTASTHKVVERIRWKSQVVRWASYNILQKRFLKFSTNSSDWWFSVLVEK